MLPWQQPQPEDGMSRREKIEWAIILLAIAALWPKIFVPHGALSNHIVYNVLVFAVLPIALIVVFVARLRRFNRAVHEQDPLKDDERYE